LKDIRNMFCISVTRKCRLNAASMQVRGCTGTMVNKFTYTHTPAARR